MTQKPANPAQREKRATAATAAKQTKPAPRGKRATAATAAEQTKPAARPARRSAPRANRRSPGYDEISERAYFISLEEGAGDEVANWLRAERELARA